MTTTNTEAVGELLPCPFCGGPATSGMTLDNMGYAMCASDACWGMAGYLETEAEAIAAWNRRAANSAGGVEVADVSIDHHAYRVAHIDPPSPAVEAEPYGFVHGDQRQAFNRFGMGNIVQASDADVGMTKPLYTHPSSPVTVDEKVLQSAVCDALLNAFPMADKIADNYAAVSVRALLIALNGKE